jgi:hypothetical protein
MATLQPYLLQHLVQILLPWVEAVAVQMMALTLMVVLEDRVAEQQIHLVFLVLQILEAQVQLDKEILAELQIQDHPGDKLEVGVAAPVLQEEQVPCKDKVVTVMHG